MSKLDLAKIANDGTALNSFVAETIKAYVNLSTRLHQAACMAMVHALEYRDDCSALNTLFNGMRVNDQTALKAWVRINTLAPGKSERNDADEPRTLIGWKKDKGFFVRKGMKSEGLFTVEQALELDSFQNLKVDNKKEINLVAILKMIEATKNKATKQAEENDVKLPADVVASLDAAAKAAHAALGLVEASTTSNLQ